MRKGKAIKQAATRATILALLWIVLSEGDPSSWLVGLPVIAAATTAAMLWRAGRPVRVNPVAATKFAGVFLIRCLAAGVDVARRSFGPRALLAPGFAHYKLRLPDSASRTLLANTVSLLPGTLSVRLDGDVLCLHVLDKRSDFQSEVARLEKLVARMLRRPGFEEQSPVASGAPT